MGPLLFVLLAIDPALARASLAELHAACEPARAFWRHDLCGPVLLVDPLTREYVTADAAGTLPADLGIANTAVDWNGQKWTMILWPLPSDRNQRLALMLHESFHRIQDSIGLPANDPGNPHLDTLDGRYWLELEWRALAAALKGNPRAIADAVSFRRRRRRLFPGSAETERGLEMSEGLAQYTGDALSGDPVRLALLDLANGETLPSFVRSFAYATGPAYGILLDNYDKNWRAGLKPTADLADMLIQAARQAVPLNPSTKPYGGASLRTSEIDRDQSRQRRVAALHKLLVDDPVLILPLEHMSMELNPSNLVPLGDLGTVYPTITVRDTWGSIVVTENALLSPDFKQLTVSSEGWKLDLKPGWKIIPAKRPGDRTIAFETH